MIIDIRKEEPLRIRTRARKQSKGKSAGQSVQYSAFVLVFVMVLGSFGYGKCNSEEAGESTPAHGHSICEKGNDKPLAAVTEIPDEQKEPEDLSGPTLYLEYGGGDLSSNPISSFMYFVPLVSPVEVKAGISDENKQYAELLHYSRQRDGERFIVRYEFAMRGKGYHQYNFDPDQIIRRGLEDYDTSSGKPLKNMLEYIRFEGEGAGRIDVFGRYEDGQSIVEKVDVHFDARGKTSPVTAGLFSVRNVNGDYDYKTRFAPTIARIRTLTFTRTEELPRMALSVSSVDQSAGGTDLLAGVKAFIANLFIEPFRINPRGNESMLEFGLALHDQEEVFTFPHAEKLVQPVLEPGSENASENVDEDGIEGS